MPPQAESVSYPTFSVQHFSLSTFPEVRVLGMEF
jgi:hypothetical protein